MLAKRLETTVLFCGRKYAGKLLASRILQGFYGLNAKIISQLSLQCGHSLRLAIGSLGAKVRKLEFLFQQLYPWLLNNSVKKVVRKNINLKKRLRSWQGIRHSFFLPVNGQCSKTNAKTQKRRKGRI